MLQKTLSLIALSFYISSCASVPKKTTPYWAKPKQTIYSKFVCFDEYERWMEFNNIQPLDSYKKGKGIAYFLGKKKNKIYKIVFFDLEDIGDYELFDEPLKDDVLQDGCKFLYKEEYLPD